MIKFVSINKKNMILRNKKGQFKKGNQKGIPLSKKTKRKIGLANKGKPNWKKGTKGLQLHSEKTKRLISLHNKAGTKAVREKNRKWHLGRKLNSKHKLKIAKAIKIKWKDSQYRKNHHEGMLGLQNTLGTKQSKETIKKRMKTMKPIFNSKKYKSKQRKNRLHQVFPTKDSKPERMVQQMLKANDIEYQTHYPIIGQPDLFVKPSVCIFVDGCYWHGCKRCHPKIWEKYRQIYEQIMYDNEITHTLTVRGYYVIRIWEHEITPNNVEVAKNVIKIIGMARS